MPRLSTLAHIAATTAPLLLPGAMAWGQLGHETVAYVATNFVSANTRTFMQDLLGDSSDDYLAAVATWADDYRNTDEGSFSSAFHYIDAQDEPPSSCGVDLERDCPGDEGCVVSAITNYTSILMDAGAAHDERVVAAKMVVHFVGDVGQPLHCEALDIGGNSIDVVFDGDDTNLHAVWDTSIPESIQTDAKTWADSLAADIRNGTYATAAAGWIGGLSVASADEQTATGLEWATDSNKWVCSTVLPDGEAAVENQELSGQYTTTAQPTVSEQIAKQGYRLAKWLDAIVDSL